MAKEKQKKTIVSNSLISLHQNRINLKCEPAAPLVKTKQKMISNNIFKSYFIIIINLKKKCSRV